MAVRVVRVCHVTTLIACFSAWSPAAATAQGARAIVGQVTDTAGIGILGAEVTVEGRDTRAYSDDRGSFRMNGVPPGSAVVRVRRLGFKPVSVVVQVGPENPAPVHLRLSAAAQALDALVIRASRVNYTGRLAGYYERLEKKQGGVFVTRDQIDLENPRTLGQLLTRVPGITTTRGRGGITQLRMRGRTCWPIVWIDGLPMPAGEADIDSFAPSTIHGIELYLGSTSAPIRYQFANDRSSCGTVLLWSRGPDTDPPRRQLQTAGQLDRLVSSLAVFTADQVEEPARPLPHQSAAVEYPPPLFAAGLRGSVVAEFVVDANGRVEPGTVGIVTSTHGLFSEAVRKALESSTYSRPIRQGQPVRQLVQQQFEFVPDQHRASR